MSPGNVSSPVLLFLVVSVPQRTFPDDMSPWKRIPSDKSPGKARNCRWGTDLMLCSSSRSNLFHTSNQDVGCRILQVVIDNKGFGVQVSFGCQAAAGYRQVKVLEFFDCPSPRQGVEDLREVELQGAQQDRKARFFRLVTMILQWLKDGWRTSNLLRRQTRTDWNIGFNESGEYKKTFIGSGVGTGSMQVLHGFEFEVEPQGDHTFEVKPQENVDQRAGLQEVQTQDLIDYQLACDRKQHLACELFMYREDSNEDAFEVAAVEKIYA
nr:leucine-rich receptor-like protein kinase family protein [Tanacetum cinerariifolium]